MITKNVSGRNRFGQTSRKTWVTFYSTFTLFFLYFWKKLVLNVFENIFSNFYCICGFSRSSLLSTLADSVLCLQAMTMFRTFSSTYLTS